MTNQPEERRVVSGIEAGSAFVQALGLDEHRVTRVLLQAEVGKPMFAHITVLMNDEEVQQVCTFLEPLETLDPLDIEIPTQQPAKDNGLWTPR
ncbi:hypothetical protein UFOVP711_56 [uncultured Caudovirales phage]|uniref:Uncharacterized protein n=1 Tax=uncultured Caudovirales phage TaxID=2100421 RepID=A0A6J5NN29_9CAUD|nr:hypothetical protein UFOVP711_56 [uncultured Caudovirales phage]